MRGGGLERHHYDPFRAEFRAPAADDTDLALLVSLRHCLVGAPPPLALPLPRGAPPRGRLVVGVAEEEARADLSHTQCSAAV